MAQVNSGSDVPNTTDVVDQNDLTHVCAIHTCSESLKQKFREITHHYCDVFTKNILTPVPETIFVNGEQYEVNKKDRLVIISYDGKLNLWQNAPTFKSEKLYAANTVILDAAGKIVSIVTGSKDGRYAIASFDGSSGKFETSHEWLTVNGMSGIIYGNKTFKSREELKDYLRGRKLGSEVDLQAIVVVAPVPRIILFDLISGREVSHTYVKGMFEASVCDKYHDGNYIKHVITNSIFL